MLTRKRQFLPAAFDLALQITETGVLIRCRDDGIGGAGADRLYGGTGDDTLVTIDGGTTDTADGQDGRDTVWRDADLNIVWNGIIPTFQTDTGSGERVQVVGGFANGADRTLNADRTLSVDGITDPAGVGNTNNYEGNPLFGSSGPVVWKMKSQSFSHHRRVCSLPFSPT